MTRKSTTSLTWKEDGSICGTSQQRRPKSRPRRLVSPGNRRNEKKRELERTRRKKEVWEGRIGRGLPTINMGRRTVGDQSRIGLNKPAWGIRGVGGRKRATYNPTSRAHGWPHGEGGGENFRPPRREGKWKQASTAPPTWGARPWGRPEESFPFKRKTVLKRFRNPGDRGGLQAEPNKSRRKKLRKNLKKKGKACLESGPNR